jgi:hypothetical protein
MGSNARPLGEQHCRHVPRPRVLQPASWPLWSARWQAHAAEAPCAPALAVQSRRDRSRRAAGEPDARQHEAWDSEDEAAFRADWHMSRAEEVGLPFTGLGSCAFCAIASGKGVWRAGTACSQQNRHWSGMYGAKAAAAVLTLAPGA